MTPESSSENDPVDYGALERQNLLKKNPAMVFAYDAVMERRAQRLRFGSTVETMMYGPFDDLQLQKLLPLLFLSELSSCLERLSAGSTLLYCQMEVMYQECAKLVQDKNLRVEHGGTPDVARGVGVDQERLQAYADDLLMKINSILGTSFCRATPEEQASHSVEFDALVNPPPPKDQMTILQERYKYAYDYELYERYEEAANRYIHFQNPLEQVYAYHEMRDLAAELIGRGVDLPSFLFATNEDGTPVHQWNDYDHNEELTAYLSDDELREEYIRIATALQPMQDKEGGADWTMNFNTMQHLARAIENRGLTMPPVNAKTYPNGEPVNIPLLRSKVWWALTIKGDSPENAEARLAALRDAFPGTTASELITQEIAAVRGKMQKKNS